MCICVSVAQSCLTPCEPMDCSLPDSSVHEILPGVGCHSLVQGIFLTQGSNLGTPVLQADSLPFGPARKPKTISRHWNSTPYENTSAQIASHIAKGKWKIAS